MLYTCKNPNITSTSTQNKFLTEVGLNITKRNLKLIRKRAVEAIVEESKNSILDRYKDLVDKE
jgi:peroxiredoxin